MRKSILTIAILLSVAVLSAQSRIISDLDAFTIVDLTFKGNVIIRQSAERHQITLKSNDNNLIENTHIEVVKGKLFITMAGSFNSRTNTNIQMVILLPHLEGLYIRGTGNVELAGAKEQNLTIINSGTGVCTILSLTVEKSLELHNTGTGNIFVHNSGTIWQETLLINNSGAGNVNISAGSVSNSLIVNNKGAGNVSVNLTSNPTEELVLQNTGSGNINIQNVSAKRAELRNQGPGNMTFLNGNADEMTLISVGAGTTNTQLMKVKTAHITHSGSGNVIATVTDTAYLTNKTNIGNVTIHGGGKLVW